MALAALSEVFRKTLIRLRHCGAGSDGELLDRFAKYQDQRAFAELVRRHGPMVLRVCQRILLHRQDAEDAFQATLIVLARKAAEAAQFQSVGGWLHGVAYRTAMNARKLRGRRPGTSEAPIEQKTAPDTANRMPADLRAVLDDELERLPDRYRAPVVLCYLEGKTTDEACQQLGWPRGTVATRLSRARDLLRQRLARRGVTLSSGAWAGILAAEAQAATPVFLAGAILAQATLAASHPTEAGGVSGQALACANETLKGMSGPNVRGLAVLLGFAILAAGVAVWLTAAERPIAAIAQSSAPETWQLLTTLEGHVEDICAVAWSADGSRLASGSVDGEIKIWDVAQAKEQVRLATNQPIYSLAFSPNGKYLASGSWIGVVQLRDASTLQEICVFPAFPVPAGAWEAKAPVPTAKRTFVCFSPDGQLLAGGSTSGGGVWEVSELLKPMRQDKEIETDFKYGSTHDGTYAVRFQRRYRMRVAERKPFLTVPSRVGPVAFSPDGQTLATTGFPNQQGQGRIALWDLRTKTCRTVLEGHTDWRINSLSISADSQTLASGGQDRVVMLWDMRTGKKRADLTGHGGGVWCVAFSRQGTRLASAGSDDNLAKIWDVLTGKEIATLAGHAKPVIAVAFSPDGKLLASSGVDRTVKLWRIGQSP